MLIGVQLDPFVSSFPTESSNFVFIAPSTMLLFPVNLSNDLIYPGRFESSFFAASIVPPTSEIISGELFNMCELQVCSQLRKVP